MAGENVKDFAFKGLNVLMLPNAGSQGGILCKDVLDNHVVRESVVGMVAAEHHVRGNNTSQRDHDGIPLVLPLDGFHMLRVGFHVSMGG